MTTLPNFEWLTTTLNGYTYALNCLPPTERRGTMFLVGEPYDHRGEGDAARFNVYGYINGVHCKGRRPVTVVEFFTLAGAPLPSPGGSILVGEFGGFTVTIVRKGDHYGRNNCVTHNEDAPMVEFYDARYKRPGFTSAGQFVSRYYLHTLRLHVGDLNLMGHEPEWRIGAADLKAAIAAVYQALCD